MGIASLHPSYALSPVYTLRAQVAAHEVEVFGTGESSAKRGAAMLREECPRG